MLTSSHVNRTLVLRIYLLKSPKKVRKIGEKSVIESPTRTPIYGGHPGGGHTLGGTGGDSRRPPPVTEPLEGLARLVRLWLIGAHLVSYATELHPP